MEEGIGLLLELASLVLSNQHSENVRSHISLGAHLVFAVLNEEAVEDLNAVEFSLGNWRLLKVEEVLDTVSAILNDSINHGEGPRDEFSLAADQADDHDEGLEELSNFSFCLSIS